MFHVPIHDIYLILCIVYFVLCIVYCFVFSFVDFGLMLFSFMMTHMALGGRFAMARNLIIIGTSIYVCIFYSFLCVVQLMHSLGVATTSLNTITLLLSPSLCSLS